MGIDDLFALVRRWWWTLLLAPLIGGLTGYALASGSTPVYDAEARLLVGPVSAEVDTIRAAGQLAQTYAELVTSDLVLQPASEQLGAALSSETVTASANTTTRVLDIEVQAPDPDAAATTANILGDELANLIRQRPVGPEGELRVVDLAEPASAPSAPEIPLITGLAAVAALLIAAALILLIEYFDDTIKSERDLARVSPTGVLGSLRAYRGAGTGRSLVVEVHPNSHSAAAYRLLATKIGHADTGRGLRSLAVVSAGSGESSGELASNLAVATASSKRTVALVNADRRDRQLIPLLGLNGERTPNGSAPAVQSDNGHHQLPGHRLLERGPGVIVVAYDDEAAQDVTTSEDAQRLVQELSGSQDLVVVHAGSASAPDSLIWAHVTDATLLVAFRDLTRRSELRQAIESVRTFGGDLAGVVLLDDLPASTWRSAATAVRAARSRRLPDASDRRVDQPDASVSEDAALQDAGPAGRDDSRPPRPQR